MNSCPSRCKEDIRNMAFEVGAVACGMARTASVAHPVAERYESWIADGCNGEMAYCEKYMDIRLDLRMLLDNANTVICTAFPYFNDSCHLPLASKISRYAWGDDYHYVIKSRLGKLASFITDNFGGECRVLVDSAPIMERYWAVKSGIGFTGLNGQLIVPGAGSYCFLGEVLWTGVLPEDTPCTRVCNSCMACVKACPGHALDGSGRCDARKCVSYLTIEHRSDLSPDANLSGSIYGCDICQRVCPHNRDIPSTPIPEFKPINPILSCDVQEILDMTSSHYRRLTRHSAMTRVPVSQLRRNISHKS